MSIKTKHVAILVILLVGVGCSSWRVLTQADPCPYSDQRAFAVTDLVFEGVYLPPPEAFTSRKAAVDLNRDAQDRHVVRDGFLTSLIETAEENGITLHVVTSSSAAKSPYRLEPRVTRLLPGGPTIMDAVASEVEITVAVVDRRGRVVDEIALLTGTDPTGEYFDRDRRLRRGAQLIGERTAAYLATRIR